MDSAAFLLEATRTLMDTLDYRQTIERLARLAVPQLADWCAVYLANDAGELDRVEVVHIDESRIALAYELQRRYPPNPESPSGIYNVYRTGKSELVREITDDMLTENISDPEYLNIVRELGLRSMMTVPLIAHAKKLGAMTFVYAESGRLYDHGDVVMAEDLASRAAIAADNARLFEAVQQAKSDSERREREESALRMAAEAVAATFSVERVIAQIAKSALDATAADGSFVERLEPDGKAVVVVAVGGTMHPEIGTSFDFEGSIAQYVLERKQPELIPVLGQTKHPLPGVLAKTQASGSALAVPLIDAGEAIGTLILLRGKDREPFTQDEAKRAHTFGNLAALAFRKVHLLEDSEKRREELEQVTESRARLMRGFTHDLKNPIGAADGHAALLEDGVLGPLTESQMKSVKRIRHGLQSAVALINDLMELARVEAGQLHIRQHPLDVREIVREMVEQYRPAAEKAGLRLTGMLEKADIVPGDADRVRQILGNLLSNAVKYTESGGSIEVRTGNRRSDNGLDGKPGVMIDVADTGIGIPEDKLGALFNEFERIDPTVRPGAGLGLAISRRLARLMGGDITVRTQRGSGSSFTLWLPQAEAD